jgi:hypothetical protein
MALDASQVLGSRQLAGVKVNPRGMAKRVAGGVAGRLPARIVYGQSDRATSATPSFGRLGYLAVTDDELALITLKSGLVTVKIDEVVVRIPRSDVASAELGSGVVTPITIGFADGGSWQLEVPPPNKKHAQAVVHALDADGLTESVDP